MGDIIAGGHNTYLALWQAHMPGDRYYAPRTSHLCVEHLEGQTGEQLGEVNSFGPLRWARSGKDSLVAACDVNSTFRGDLLVVLMLQCVSRRAMERNPNKH